MAISDVTLKRPSSLFATAAVALAAAFPARARAQDAAGTAPPGRGRRPTPPPATGPRMVGGHVGAAVPWCRSTALARPRRRRRTS